MDVSPLLLCVVRGFCVGPITHPQELYQVWCASLSVNIVKPQKLGGPPPKKKTSAIFLSGFTFGEAVEFHFIVQMRRLILHLYILKCLQNFPSTFTFRTNFRVVFRTTEIHARWLATSVISAKTKMRFLLYVCCSCSNTGLESLMHSPRHLVIKCGHYSWS
jgi:hypothetical protein